MGKIKKQNWTCARRKTCRARVHTVSGQVVFRSPVHTHAPDTAEAAARLVVSRMVALVTTGHESTRNVIRGAIQGASESTLAAMPSRRTLSRQVQLRARCRLNPTPPIPVQRSGFGIPDKYTKTAALGLRFLQYDSGIDDADRILIFASDKNLDLLVRHRQWLADGTFKCSPSVFYQLFVCD